MASDKHIALITPGFADGETDTGCIPALQHWVRALAQNGCSVTVFALHYPFRNDRFVWHGVTVIPLNGANRFWKRKLLLPGLLKKQLYAEHARQPFTHMHGCWLNEATLLAIRFGKQLKLPVSATAMGQDVLPGNSYLKRIRRNDLRELVTLSSFQHDQLFQTTGWKAQVIHWGLPAPVLAKERTVDLVGAGNLIALKNYRYAVEICRYLKTERPRLSVYLIGSGPGKAALEQYIRQLGLEDHIRLTGQLSYEQTLEHIAAARVLIHPSLYEGFGMVLIEALSAGTLVFAQNTGIAATESAIQPLTGDAQQDAKAISAAMDQAVFRQKHYSVQTTVLQYLETVFY